MHPLVRDCYKRLLIAGAHYPKGLAYVRSKVKGAFLANATLADEVEIKRAVAKGRWWARELHAINSLHKYRAMKHRYYD